MTVEPQCSFDAFYNHPEIQKIVHKVNDSLISRRKTRPPHCTVFDQPYGTLEEDTGYCFELDKEALKQLPKLIHNKVQRVQGGDVVGEAVKRAIGRARRIGIVFSGGPAPGGHNVIAGLFDAAKRANPENRIFGFILGPEGIIEGRYIEITEEMVDAHRNLGGFGMIKTGRVKIDTPEKMALSRKICKELKLDSLVIVGGDDSNTNAAFLAQAMFEDGVQVIGVPKTIDGDVQVRDAKGSVLCAMSFGFHSAARAFSQEVSNLCTDCSSDMKYWHICKVMGRSASHLALEVALQTHANITVIGEDLADYVDDDRLKKAKKEGTVDFNSYGMTLRHLSRVICDGIVRRAEVGKNYGVLVIPEGVLEFINEIQVFILKLNTIIADYNHTHDIDFHTQFTLLDDKLEYLRRLARQNREQGGVSIWDDRYNDLFNDLPAFFQEGLLIERDSHGNFQFSLVETDKVIMELVKDYLNTLKESGVYKIGIQHSYFDRVMREAGLDPDRYGKVLFKNYPEGVFLLMRSDIISMKTLQQALKTGKLLQNDDKVPKIIEKILKLSIPNFKTQTHFYGYDGRGSHPTEFDCRYTYNLGLTVFSLIANGATGQMAAIKNLEKSFDQWEPVGIPIAPLMHLEERKGRLELVLEKSLVDVNSPAFLLARASRESWLAAVPGEDDYRTPAPIHPSGQGEEDRPLTLLINDIGERVFER
jgi:diphosphate-dependent phosphofructokinase